jgi:hypothetical protein
MRTGTLEKPAGAPSGGPSRHCTVVGGVAGGFGVKSSTSHTLVAGLSELLGIVSEQSRSEWHSEVAKHPYADSKELCHFSTHFEPLTMRAFSPNLYSTYRQTSSWGPL